MTRRIFFQGLSSSSSIIVVLLSLLVVLELASADFATLEPPLAQPNDIFGTVNGCANAVLAHDNNNDGIIERSEFLDYVNNVADQLCLPPRPALDLELNTLFVTIACLCTEREEFTSPACCIGPNAKFYTDGAADPLPIRTEEQDNYLRQACLMTQAVLGDEQCVYDPSTLAPGAIGQVFIAVPPVAPLPPEGPNPAWYLLLLLLCFCCIWINCCCRRDKEIEEQWETVVTEETIVKGPDGEIIEEEPPVEPDVEAPAPPPPPVVVPPPPPPPPEEPEPEPKPPTPTPTPPPTPPPPPPLPPPPEEPEPFDAGDEFDEEGDQPRPGPPEEPPEEPPMVDEPPPPVPVVPQPPEEEPEDESEGKAKDPGSDDEDSQAGRKFRGEGLLPEPPEPEGVVLRPVVIVPPEPAEYEYPERELIEPPKEKDEDSVQEFEPYIPDGGVYDPKRPVKPPVEFNPSWQREEKPEPVYIDPRKQRIQMKLGDGDVWEHLDDWEEEEEKTGMENNNNNNMLLEDNCLCVSEYFVVHLESKHKAAFFGLLLLY